MKVLITGHAGFIGHHLAHSLVDDSRVKAIKGVDNLNTYYSRKIKISRDKTLNKQDSFSSNIIDIADFKNVLDVFSNFRPDAVVHLAAQAGVRHDKPRDFLNSNYIGFLNIVEACTIFGIDRLIYASSSSVYGNTNETPFNEDMKVSHPASLYAASKIANEHMINTIRFPQFKAFGLRFFSVYGPCTRPDLALYKFFDCLTSGNKPVLYHPERIMRSWTYIDDVVEAIEKCLFIPDVFERTGIYNIGSSETIRLIDAYNLLVEYLDVKKNPGYDVINGLMPDDIMSNACDNSKAKKILKWEPKTDFKKGLKNFVEWAISLQA